ncbi:SDR family oxidoreductase [Candidatus Methanoperedens nitratireducens]|uniref:Vi polysaccharide biosynthesis protein VipB/TviC n=1 Tax=Candidatus Methanoperedens nitratireducens TaxID=1392998 RepID=A0A284VUT1_9EURY|nr:SDR family oxidoreductase [Candidatus Methanoperedens nitroreducens]SNQ62969.1 Vi polysaccharide biosynthesis protein VipB/TviC [Candidatus Methanoperedens nitroreducens]
MKALVTGGAGFIGSHLAEELAKDNEVIILDNLSTGRMENVKDLVKKGSVTFVKGSMTDFTLLQEIIRDVDYVFHQGAIPSVPRSIEKPSASNDANINGTLNVLMASKEAGVKKVIYASSSSVYGDAPEMPKREDMKPNPLSPYAVTKIAGEYYCKVFQEVYGLKTVSLRYFNVFGQRQDPTSEYAAVIPKFITSILNNKPPTIYGDGEQSRDFTFVKYVVEANILAAESDATGVFNIACGGRITINKLVDMINEILGKNIKPVYIAPRAGDIKHSLADISRAKSFGYEPQSNFKEGLKETIRWFNDGVS